MNFSALLTESLRQGDLSQVRSLDPWLLTDLEASGRSWALGIMERHGAPPTVEMLKSHSDHRVLLTTLGADTDLRLLYGQVVDELTHRKAEQELQALEERALMEGVYPLDDLTELTRKLRSVQPGEVDSLLTADLEMAFNQEILTDGLTFGFTGIDSAISYLLPGELLVLAARTGVGKSALVCHAAARWAGFGKRVLVVSCEMPSAQLLHRIYGLMGGFNPKLFRQEASVTVLSGLKAQVAAKLELIRAAGGDILFPRDRRLTVGALESAILEYKPDVVLVDGIYLLKGHTAREAQGWEIVKSVSNTLKQLAMEYTVPIFATTQFKRGSLNGAFTLEDIAYSDAIGQDADVVISASRDTSVVTHQLILDVIKNRSGEMLASSIVEIDWRDMIVRELPNVRGTLSLGGGVTSTVLT